MKIIFAHRGNSSEAPENTLAAFAQVPATGADGVELDVHLSSDGAVVVIHDDTLERTTDGRGAVAAQPLQSLRRLDAGGWFGPSFRGERLPTLGEVLELLAPTPLRINIELKASAGSSTGLVEAVIAEVTRHEAAERVVFASFDHTALAAAGRLAPHIERAALLRANLVEPWQYALTHGFAALHVPAMVATPALVRCCHASGLVLRAYTVDEPELAARLIDSGVDGLITNVPREMAALRERLGRAAPAGGVASQRAPEPSP